MATGVVFCGVWVWACWCQFPSHHPLNDMRTAASVGLHFGFSPYSTANSGIVTTWIYGPLALYALWPAGWANSAAGSIQISGAMNLMFVGLSLAIAVFHFGKAITARIIALLVGFALWPAFSLNIFAAEHVVIFLGIAGMVFMERGHLTFAALCAVLAAFSKQTAVGIVLAQLFWIYGSARSSGLRKHLIRVGLWGLLFAGLFAARFGVSGLWHSMVVVPGGLPWTPNLRWQLIDDGLYLFAPLVALVGSASTCRPRHRLALPALTYLFMFPLAAATFFKIGGGIGALDVSFLWLAPALVVATEKLLNRRTELAIAMAVAAGWFIKLSSSRLAVVAEVERYHQANYLAERGGCWFPLNPLITLYSDGNYYPDEDGLNERQLSGHPVSSVRIWSALPANLSRVVYPAGSNT